MRNAPLLLADGRRLDVWRGGSVHGPALVLHHGTPSDAATWTPWDSIAREHDLQLVATTRPGYAGSTRLRGRAVADAAADIAEVLQALDAPWFITVGWSGGGPHALACAARLPGCRGAATLAGVGPSGAPGLDFLAGMGPENHAEFGAARAGEHALRAWLEANAAGLRTTTAADVARDLGGLVPAVDRDALAGGFAQTMAVSFRSALAPGFDGWIDDDLAFLRPWGFGLGEIDVPVTVWQGDADLMVPHAHGAWLAAHIAGAGYRLVPGHGHISLGTTFGATVVGELVMAASAVS